MSISRTSTAMAAAFGLALMLAACSTATTPSAEPSSSSIMSATPMVTATEDPMTMEAFPKYYVTDDPTGDSSQAWQACIDELHRRLGDKATYDKPTDSAYVGSDGEWRIGINTVNAKAQARAWDCHVTRTADGTYTVVLH